MFSRSRKATAEKAVEHRSYSGISIHENENIFHKREKIPGIDYRSTSMEHGQFHMPIHQINLHWK